MDDKTPLIGAAGSVFSWGISQWSDAFGLAAAMLTCVYLLAKLYILLRKR